MIKNHATKAEILNEVPETFMRCHRGIEAAIAVLEKEDTREFRKVTTEVLTGAAGTGKTRKVHEEAPRVFTVNCEDSFPFDGYDGETEILIDDFYGGMKYNFLLRVLDGHQLRVNTKGGHRFARWTKVFITSNDPPGTWYQRGLTPALARRISYVTEFRNEVGGNTVAPTSDNIDNTDTEALIAELFA